jgi:hypothetical protein
MKILITTTLAAASLMFAIGGAYADGSTDFLAIQRGYGYDAAPHPVHWQPPVTEVQPATTHRIVYRHYKRSKVIETGVH